MTGQAHLSKLFTIHLANVNVQQSFTQHSTRKGSFLCKVDCFGGRTVAKPQETQKGFRMQMAF